MICLMHITTLVRRNKNYLLAKLHTVQQSIPAVFLMLFQPGARDYMENFQPGQPRSRLSVVTQVQRSLLSQHKKASAPRSCNRPLSQLTIHCTCVKGH